MRRIRGDLKSEWDKVRERDRGGFIPGSFHAPRGMIEFWVDPDSPYFKDVFGNYDLVWWSAIVMGLVASLMNYPIDDRPVERAAAPETA